MEDWKWGLCDFFEQWVFCLIFQIIYSLPLWNDLFVFGDCISWVIQQSWGLRKKKWKPVCVLETWAGQLQFETWRVFLTGIFLTRK